MTSHDLDALRRIATDPAVECHGIVTRDSEQDACGKPATTVIDARAAEDGAYWPACTFHAYRYGTGHVVPLTALAEALR